MANGSGATIVAAVNTANPAGAPPAPDLSVVPATNIQVKFREALGNELPNAEHAYIDVTRANGTHQVIGAYPVGGTYQTHEGGQLTFEAGQEKRMPTAAEFELKAPKGMTLTQYANELVDGAKAYNAHPVRYDGIGENGFNSNSFISSLIVAKGGPTGLADVERIASVVDTSPVRTFGEPSTMDDAHMADLVRRDYESGRLVASGFGHAAIEPQRFARDAGLIAATPPPGTQLSNATSAAPALFIELKRSAVSRLESAFEGGQRAETSVTHGTVPPPIPGSGVMHIRYAGEDRQVGPGYRQSGTITSVRDGIVTQSTGRSTAEYKLSDLTADAKDPDAMASMLLPGRDVQISVGQDHVHVASLERNRDLDRSQRHGIER